MKKNIKKSGFTLVETLVAISILIVSITGAFGAAQKGISSSILSKDQVIAFYLAAEGVEQIRNIRDENTLKGQNWLTGISSSASDPCYFGNYCTVEVANVTTGLPSIVRCSGQGMCSNLAQNPTNGYYGYNLGWPNTNFKREVSLKSINPNEIAILVKITWSKGAITRTFNIRENILNWQQ